MTKVGTTLFCLINMGGKSFGLEFSIDHINLMVLTCLEVSSKYAYEKTHPNFSQWKLDWATSKNSLDNWILVWPTLIRQNNVDFGKIGIGE